MTIQQELDERIAGQTVATRFLDTVGRHGDTAVLRWKQSDGSWSEQSLNAVAETTARLVTAFRGRGLGKGDRVVLMMRNRPEFHPIDLAVLFCGATPVSIYNSSAPDQIEYLVNHCGAKMAVLEDDGFIARFESVRDRLPSLESIVVVEESEATDDSIVRYGELLTHEPADLAEAAAAGEPSDLATVIYTSGTTGPPKGVMLSNYNIVWSLESISRTMRAQTDLENLAGFRHVSYLPMAHIMERLLGHYYMVEFATQVTCCPDTAQVAAYAAEVHPNLFIGVPRVWEKLHAGVMAAIGADPEKAQPFADALAAAEPIAAKLRAGTATQEERETYEFLDAVAFTPVKQLIGLDEAQVCISGAAPLQPDVMSWFQTIGVPLSEGYGMSETTAVLTWSHAAKPGHVGQPVVGVEMKLGEDGEVLARGGNMFEGYLDAPDKTAETMDDEGWVHTGDIGEIDEDGFLRIVDRKKELLVTAGGKNISPANLEAALKSIPLVGQACAVGDQKPFVAALVVLDADASKAWAAEHGLEGEAATMQAMAENPDVIADIEAGLAEAMSTFNNAESVKKVKILGEEWMPDTDLLTPTSKLKRRGILTKFADDIDAMYVR
ncbi:AMP-dependent synthetase/ligase [Ilumatobacter sp.]|uniref:AMP-dependent synthetase/ligase n=1 Tax=Ilumatobacter sp. TaxID=1967498 RepID=UPI003AF5C647